MRTLAEWLKRLRSLPWNLWTLQVRGIVAFEMKKYLFGRRFFFLFLLAFVPALLLGLRMIAPSGEAKIIQSLGGVSVLFSVFFRTFFLRLLVFFGCVGVFTRLFRGDVLEKTLHFYFLCPVRREVLVVGKYLSALLLTTLFFGFSITASYLLLWAPSGWASFEEFVWNGPGLGHWAAYLGITLLACVGYGAVFLLTGLFFRNPIVPAASILGWEYINFLLPATLKKISVIYYLESLCPVPIPEGPITLLAEPAPLWMSVPGMLVVTFLVLYIASQRIRSMEISYTSE